ncbi:hypothetical protein BDV41DRAFT_553488 [Aspergillus transmontanensis]|uniref:Uncharacterized protein n=1 Tax=Aspergillus transmontanensis TaxID=1034304 RepID=A0A5N6VHJ6_9EURO|nr:hypothetical protein BDV41DRAFT_553488 [Aspergillus transmontanensis]
MKAYPVWNTLLVCFLSVCALGKCIFLERYFFFCSCFRGCFFFAAVCSALSPPCHYPVLQRRDCSIEGRLYNGQRRKGKDKKRQETKNKWGQETKRTRYGDRRSKRRQANRKKKIKWRKDAFGNLV